MPPDLEWTAEIRTAPPLILAARSGSDGPDLSVPLRLDFLLKRPWGLSDSTRSPTLFKNIYAEALFYSLSPLSSLKIEPAVLPGIFHELDPRANLKLRFSPQFLQKTPWNFSFLTNKPLELVLGLVYAF